MTSYEIDADNQLIVTLSLSRYENSFSSVKYDALVKLLAERLQMKDELHKLTEICSDLLASAGVRKYENSEVARIQEFIEGLE